MKKKITNEEKMAIILLKMRLLNLKLESDYKKRQRDSKKELIKYLRPLFE